MGRRCHVKTELTLTVPNDRITVCIGCQNVCQPHINGTPVLCTDVARAKVSPTLHQRIHFADPELEAISLALHGARSRAAVHCGEHRCGHCGDVLQCQALAVSSVMHTTSVAMRWMFCSQVSPPLFSSK